MFAWAKILPLFDSPAAEGPPTSKLRESGSDRKKRLMDTVLRRTPDWYRDAFRSAVAGFPSGKTFTVEDVREIAGDPPSNEVSPNCMGSLMMMVARMRLAKKTGYYVKAKRPKMNATDLAVWCRI
jgi:hypothetical protein